MNVCPSFLLPLLAGVSKASVNPFIMLLPPLAGTDRWKWEKCCLDGTERPNSLSNHCLGSAGRAGLNIVGIDFLTEARYSCLRSDQVSGAREHNLQSNLIFQARTAPDTCLCHFCLCLVNKEGCGWSWKLDVRGFHRQLLNWFFFFPTWIELYSAMFS